MGIPDHLICLLRNLYVGLEATVRTRYGATDRFQIGKGVHEGCHPDYWTYMQTTSCKIPGWMKHKLKSGCGEKYQEPQICKWHHPNGIGQEELKNFLMKVIEEHEKAGLKLSIQTMKIMASGSISSWPVDEEPVETVRDFIFLGSKITSDGNCDHKNWMMLAPWKKSYGKLRQCIKEHRHCFADKCPYSQSYGFSSSHVWAEQ